VTAELAEHGIALARRPGDPLAESAALDLRTSVLLARGDIRAAAASALRRTELLAPLRRRAIACGLELFDAYQMAAETAIAAGDLAAARELAGQDETAAFGERFREGWERAGRPRAGNLSRGPYAAAAVCGLRGDDTGRAAWLTMANALASPGLPLSEIHHDEFFDALVLLHGGRPEEAVTLPATPPEDFRA
jgi:hypothetical protein